MSSDKQARFAAEYLVDQDITAAAVRAGYTRKSARKTGSRLLRHPEVADAIRRGKERLAQKIEVTQERIVQELAAMGFANMADYMVVGDDGVPAPNYAAMTRAQWAAVQEVIVEDEDAPVAKGRTRKKRARLKLADKEKSLTKLGDHLGMWKTKLEIGGLNGQPINAKVEVEFVRSSNSGDASPATDPDPA